MHTGCLTLVPHMCERLGLDSSYSTETLRLSKNVLVWPLEGHRTW